jgi:hypothetical protein
MIFRIFKGKEAQHTPEPRPDSATSAEPGERV